jgi:large subunit ribosomal protein L21
MYAIFVDGGRQYRAEPGQELVVDYRDMPAGSSVELGPVLAVHTNGGLKLGSPEVPGARVVVEVVGPMKGDKIFVEKFRRRKNSRRRTGHRQIYTRVKVREISGV